jgi:uncharacterized protein YkwD
VLLRILLLALLLPASARADAGEEKPDCEDEVPLSQAAAELLLAGQPPSSEQLSSAIRAAGSDLVGVHAYFWRAGEHSAPAWLAELARRADAKLVCGFAQSAAARLLLAAPRAGSLAPLSAKSTRIRGTLAARFRDAELVVSDGDDELQRITLSRSELVHGVALPEMLPRPALVQLLARGPAGPRPLAERILPAEDHPVPAARANAHASEPAEAEADDANEPSLFSSLSALRKEHRRPSLRANQLLDRVASEHAQRVCGEGRVAHELEPGEDPERRLREAGVEAQRVGETVARARSGAAALAAFERSPSHRLTLLEPGFTDAGVGKADDAQGRHCVVILLAAWPRFVGR